MSPLPFRNLGKYIIICCIVLPLIAFSQVKIKEKVEIKPIQPAASSRDQLGNILASDRFYHPPLFVVDQTSGKVGLPLASTLTIAGSLNVGGEMSYGNQVILLDVGQFGQEHRIAWKIRATAPNGGGLDEGTTPYTGNFTSGAYPDVRLYLFDYTWWNGTRTFVINGDALTYNFTGSLFKSMSDPLIPVTATAMAAGSQNSSQLFDRWRIQAPPEIVVSGIVSVPLTIRPLNAGGGVHLPWGIPLSEAEMTVRVDCSWEYVRLSFGTLSGQQINMPLGYVFSGRTYWNSPRLVYDPSKGTFPGPSMIVNITVARGGIETTFPVTLTKPTTCAHVAFTKSTLNTGETTTLEITKEDGSPIGPTEAFDVDIMAGSGTLEASGKSGTSLSNVLPPVTYTAPESIEGDELVVQVAAYSYYSGEGGASASLATPVVSPSLKKVTGIVSTQSVSPRSDPAALERIGRILASSVCSVGEAVVQKKACLTEKDPDAIRHVTDEMFKVNGPINNSSHCDEKRDSLGNKFTAGVTWFESADYSIGEHNFNFAIASLTINISWGYCIDKIRNNIPGVKLVDEALSTITTLSEARAAIADFQRFQPDGSFVGPLTYYPLLKTKSHEFEHVEQYKSRLRTEYDRALFEINNVDAPSSDWCNLGLFEKARLRSARESKVSDRMNDAATAFASVAAGEDLETPAYQTEYMAVATELIPALKLKFGIK